MNELKAIRKKTGLTQAEFAKRYNIPKRTVENWETEVTEVTVPPRYVVELLKRAVDADLED